MREQCDLRHNTARCEKWATRKNILVFTQTQTHTPTHTHTHAPFYHLIAEVVSLQLNMWCTVGVNAGFGSLSVNGVSPG